MFGALAFLHFMCLLQRQDISGQEGMMKESHECVVRSLTGFNPGQEVPAMCGPDLWPPCEWISHEEQWVGEEDRHQHREMYLSLAVELQFYLSCCSQRHVWIHGCFRQHHWAETTEWFQSVSGSWNRESETAHSHLIPAQTFPQTNSAWAPGKWERNIPFPLRQRNVALMGSAGSARPRPVCPFPSEAGM